VFEKTRQSRVSPASPYIPPPRRSGRSPALPYPPGGQNEYSRFFHSTQPAFPGRAMPEKTTLFLADETRSEHFCAVQGELGLTCPIEGWAKRQRSPPNFSRQVRSDRNCYIVIGTMRVENNLCEVKKMPERPLTYSMSWTKLGKRLSWFSRLTSTNLFSKTFRTWL